MNLVSTTIATKDNQLLVVPNNTIWGNIITNITGSDTRRVDLTFRISYEDDIERAPGHDRGVVENHPLVLEDPEPVIAVGELGPVSVNLICRPGPGPTITGTSTGDHAHGQGAFPGRRYGAAPTCRRTCAARTYWRARPPRHPPRCRPPAETDPGPRSPDWFGAAIKTGAPRSYRSTPRSIPAWCCAGARTGTGRPRSPPP